MTRSTANTDKLSDSMEDAALRHFARLRSGDPAAQADLERWLEADPAHRAAYDDLRQLWGEIGIYRSEPAILEMREEALGALRHRRRLRVALTGLAATVALAVGVGTIWYQGRPGAGVSKPVPERQFATSVGKMQTVVLADGSTAVMDSDSAISVRVGQSGERKVRVTRGRALFEVAKLPGRTFTVEAGPVAVIALGTKFDVYHKVDGVDVDLVEGRLRVEEAGRSADVSGPDTARLEMTAGDRLEVRRDKWLLARGAIGRSVDWTGGQLVFEQATIAEIVGELARYTDRRLVIADSAAGSRRMSAVIRIDDPLAFLSALRAMRVVQVRQVPMGYIIESADRRDLDPE